MSRKSKRTQTLSAFSAVEREIMGGGTQKLRLGRDSLRTFNACGLCLAIARTPVICPGGHLFCKECIVTSLLTQRATIKSAAATLASTQALAANEASRISNQTAIAAAEAAEKASRGISSHSNGTQGLQPNGSSTNTLSASVQDPSRLRVVIDDPVLERIRKAEAQEDGSQSRTGVFWVPSALDGAADRSTEAATKAALESAASKSSTMCPEGNHPLKSKHLIPVIWTKDPSSKDAVMCPVCRKTLSNAPRLAASKLCGHVCCAACLGPAIGAGEGCPVCSTPTPKGKKDVVVFAAAGTGFAGHGERLSTEKKELVPLI